VTAPGGVPPGDLAGAVHALKAAMQPVSAAIAKAKSLGS